MFRLLISSECAPCVVGMPGVKILLPAKEIHCFQPRRPECGGTGRTHARSMSFDRSMRQKVPASRCFELREKNLYFVVSIVPHINSKLSVQAKTKIMLNRSFRTYYIGDNF